MIDNNKIVEMVSIVLIKEKKLIQAHLRGLLRPILDSANLKYPDDSFRNLSLLFARPCFLGLIHVLHSS